jgi:hypothetical protein
VAASPAFRGAASDAGESSPSVSYVLIHEI